MRKITLTEWAIENKVHYNTAVNRFKAGKISGAYKNEYNRIFVLVDKTPEEEDIARYNSMVAKEIENTEKKLARLRNL